MKFAHFSHVWNKPGMTPAERYHQLWRELQLADELGYDYGFAVEHHFTPLESWMAVPSLYCVAAGLRTRQIRLGAMGHIVPLHNPLRLAEEIAVADQMLEGRLELGIVPGILPSYFAPFNGDFQNRRDRTLEFVAFIKKAFTTADHFDFEGRYHQFKNVKLSINPVQMPHPPMWIETRDPATLEFCAREGINTGYFTFLPHEDAVAPYTEYLRLWKQAGWRRKPNIAYLTLVYVDESDAKALETAIPHVVETYKGFLTAAGRAYSEAEQEKLAQFFEQRGEHGAADIIRNLLNVDYLLEHNLIFVGSPATVVKNLQKVSSSKGMFNTFFGEFNFGTLGEDDLMRSIRLFGTEVMPGLRDFEPF
jgi:alkanesulfonate monooxygenase SsuD/methylene tetrahydromethanopterin reductase-like flavin-dependent oxidoreductase (luciferase family)